jgi:uncharacterized protein YhaN
MQIREIYIDGFGIFRDRQAKGLSSGINVIYGPNEFGKSTLLDFIRRILFGFPSRASSSINPYPALNGGAYGGRLVCQLASGKFMTIARKEGPHRGSVTIILDSKELSGQEELNKLLDSIGERFYQNVYAIGLNELERLESLEADEVRSHIYGAGLGLGSITLKSIKNKFLNQAEAVFKQGGSAQLIPKLYKEIRALEKDISDIKRGLSEYDELVKQLDKRNENVKTLDKQIIRLEKEKRSLENQDNLFQTYVDLKTAEEDLANLEELPLFAEGALRELETLKTEISNLDERIKEETGELKDLIVQRDQLVYDEKIIEAEPLIISLQKKSEQFASANRDIEPVKSDRTRLAGDIQTNIARIGHGWTEEKIQNFNLSLCQEDVIRIFKRGLEEAKSNIERIKTKQESLRDKKATEASKGFAIPASLKYAAYLVTALGLICSVFGFMASQILLAALSFIVCITGVALILYIYLGKPRGLILPDALDKKYNEDLSSAESAFNGHRDKWHKFLRDIDFDESLSPDGALDIVRAIREIKSNIKTRDELDTRIGKMQGVINSVKEVHDQIVMHLDKSKTSDDIAANIEILTRLLSTANGTKRDRQGFEDQIARKIEKIKGIEDHKKLAENRLQTYIASLGAKDEADFRLKYAKFLKRKDLEGKIENSSRVIQSTVGIDDHYNNFIESISQTSPEEIETKLEEVNRRLERLEGERDQTNQTIGGLEDKIKNLSSSGDLLVKQSEIEVSKQQLRDHALEWVTAQIALFVLDKAISKYENTRQPEVIKATKDIFTNITNNAYSMIIKSAETNEIKIQDAVGQSKGVLEMSKGTKEQLYFAMRLGLIKVYEAEKEPMPIIMDDILVNFDDDRGPLAIKELAKFARDRQVVVLTCHKNALDLYKSLGAKEIIFN